MCSFKNGRLDGIHNPQAHFLHPNTSCWRCLRGGVAQLLHNSTQRAVHFLFWKVQGFRWFTHTRTKKKTGAVVLFFKFLDKLPRSVCRNSSHASGTPPHATQASRVELLVDAHGEPHVELDDVRLLVVTGGVAGELEDLDQFRRRLISMVTDETNAWHRNSVPLSLAYGHYEKGEYAQALPLFEQARASFEAAGDRAGVGFACDFIASCDENMGQPARALPPEPRGGGASSGPRPGVKAAVATPREARPLEKGEDVLVPAAKRARPNALDAMQTMMNAERDLDINPSACKRLKALFDVLEKCLQDKIVDYVVADCRASNCILGWKALKVRDLSDPRCCMRRYEGKGGAPRTLKVREA